MQAHCEFLKAVAFDRVRVVPKMGDWGWQVHELERMLSTHGQGGLQAYCGFLAAVALDRVLVIPKVGLWVILFKISPLSS